MALNKSAIGGRLQLPADLLGLVVWTVVVYLATSVALNLKAAESAQINLKLSLTDNIEASVDTGSAYSNAAGPQQGPRFFYSKFNIASPNGKSHRGVRNEIHKTKLHVNAVESPNSMKLEEFLEESTSLDKESVNAHKYLTGNHANYIISEEAPPLVLPVISPINMSTKETVKKTRMSVDSSSNTIAVSAAHLVSKKQSPTEPVKHVLIVTNDFIPPAVKPESRNTSSPKASKRSLTDFRSGFFSLQMSPGRMAEEARRGANFNYNEKDVSFSYGNQIPKSVKRQESESVINPTNQRDETVETHGSITAATPRPPPPLAVSQDHHAGIGSITDEGTTAEGANNVIQAPVKLASDGVEIPRSSDPGAVHTMGHISYDPADHGEINIPSGQFDTMDIDVPGEPLTPKDFALADIAVNDPIDTTSSVDPTTMAEQFEGDIELVEDDKPINQSASGFPNPRSGLVSSERLWPNGTVPYLISSTYNHYERSVIALALSNFHAVSCVRFVPRTNQRDYIHFLRGDGCSSNVGRIGGSQALSLGPGCLHVGVVMHELMHALGFWHEQSRSDRDSYVKINWSNIQHGKGYNFQKYDFKGLQHVGVQYDLSSLMHFSHNAFAKNRSLPTVEPISGNHVVGQRRGLSKDDSRRLRELYPCPNATEPTIFPNVHQPTVTLPPPVPGLCRDSDYHCPVWAGLDECTKNAAWMKLNCKQSCKQCGVKCQDLNDQCEVWKHAGECENNAPYMHLYCQKTCELCPGDLPGKGCQDLNVDCEKWATMGNCALFPGYMLLFCKKACMRC